MQRALLKALKAWLKKPNRKPLLLQGARQVGKTYLLKYFGKQCFPHVFYINFENQPHFHRIFQQDLDPTRILQELSIALGRDINPAHDFLIFDEIQACPPALTSLKYFNENCPQLALAAAGSLLGVHLGESSFPVGQVDMLKLHPLNFIEFLTALKQERLLSILDNHDWHLPLPEMAHQQYLDLWKRYLVTGGMPEVVMIYTQHQDQLVTALKEVRIKQAELIHAYSSDIAKHAGQVNAMHITRVWEQAAIQLSKTQNEMAARFRFKDVVPGIDKYQRLVGAIDWLDAANLIIKIPIVHTVELPLMAYAKESLFKLLYLDVGLLGARCGLTASQIMQNNYGSYKGYMAENFIAQELSSVDIHDMETLYSWKENKIEIEFLQTSDFGIIPIEVKSGENIKAKSLEKYSQKYHPKRSVILSAKNLNYEKEQGLLYCPLYLASLRPWLSVS